MSFFSELKRRNVFRVGVAYVVLSWLVLQIADVMLGNMPAPAWVFRVLLFFLAVGFPFALIFAWAFELTPEGIKRESEIDRGRSITTRTGRKLDFLIIGVLGLALAYFVWESRFDSARVSPAELSVLEKSIAILPFENRSADAEDSEFFSAGMHDELLTLLSRLGDLKVISRTSVERLDPKLSLPEIATLLGVATVLEGQVQRAGNRLRINVQLIDAQREDHLWATTYDRELTAGNVFDVQSDIARAIADALHAQLSPTEEILLDAVPTKNTEALNHYLLGKQQASRSSFESLRLANDYFTQATRLDPDYAQAWTAIADALNQMLDTGMIDVAEFVTSARPAISRALELDDRLPEAHALLASLKFRTGDIAGAETSFNTALELDPGDPNSLGLYGKYLRMTGRPGAAIPLLERALENNPLSVEILFELGKSEMYLGNPEQNVQYAERILKIDPANAMGNFAMLQAYLWEGRFDLTWPWFIKSFSTDPEDFENWSHLGWYAEMLGNPLWADRYMDRALQLGPEEPAVLKCLAQLLMHRGNTAEATVIAHRALEEGLDDRWSSNHVFLRLVRDEALETGNFEKAIAWYRTLHPELFRDSPKITVDNVNSAADLALLMRVAGDPETTEALIKAGLTWYEETQPPGVHGYLLNIVDIELLALNGEIDAALDALQIAVNDGWNFNWTFSLDNENLASLRDQVEFQAIGAHLESEMAIQLEAITRLPYMGEFDLRSVQTE